MRKVMAALVGSALVLASAVGISLGPGQQIASAGGWGCTGTWSLGIGGLEGLGWWQGSGYLQSNQPVGYHSGNARAGYDELNRLFWDHRNECPGDHIKMIGHSQGAAIIHAWVTNNQHVPNANAILLSDPKRWAPGNGGPGMSNLPGNQILGWPLAGVDDWFGGFPVLTVCRWDDWVCNLDAPWGGSHFTGSHGWYDMSAWSYGDWDSGVVMI